jgi:hypothetical protein
VAKFHKGERHGITGNCGISHHHNYPTPAFNGGCLMNFVGPYEAVGARQEAVTVETPAGPVYLQLSMEKGIPGIGNDYPGDSYMPEFAHFVSYQNWREDKEAKVAFFSRIITPREGVEKGSYNEKLLIKDDVHWEKLLAPFKEKDALIYESKPFYNNQHSERDFPSIILYIINLEKLQ